MDIIILRVVSDENSIFKYEVDLSVGGRDFVMRFRNNKSSHKIDCLWVGTADDGKKSVPTGGEEKSSLMIFFKEYTGARKGY